MKRLVATATIIIGVWGLLIGGSPSQAAPAGSGCGQALRIVEGAQVASPAFLAGVDGTSSTDVWAVGQYQGGHGLAERWDGANWVRIPTPSPGDTDTLFSVSAVSPEDAWAVGAYDDGIHHSLTEHWDGRSWNLVSVPGRTDLNGVDARTSTDVWAVGANVSADRWDGTAWTQIPHPAIIEEGELHAVKGFAADDAWAVGVRGTEGGGGENEVSLLLHWDGEVLNLIVNPDPLIGRNSGLFGVDGVSSDDVWAVGDAETANGGRTLALHYDGAGWSVVPTPNPSSVENELRAVSAVAPDDVWAVGTFSDGTTEHPLALHWDGTRWNRVRTQAAPGAVAPDSLVGVHARPDAEVYAVGLAGPSDPESLPLIEQSRAC